MRERDVYILNELKRKRGRNLTPEEMDAIAKLYIAEQFNNATLPDSTHRRFKVFDEACRAARRKAARRPPRASRLVEFGLKAKR